MKIFIKRLKYYLGGLQSPKNALHNLWTAPNYPFIYWQCRALIDSGVLHRRCQIITKKSVIFLRSFCTNLHWTEKIYTGSARGDRDKYQVYALTIKPFNLYV